MAQRWLSAAAAVVAAIVTIALVEGLASLAICAGLFLGGSGQPAMQLRARYDPEIGWVGAPDLAIPNMYGPGVGLHTTARGFRGTVEPGPLPPPGKTRVVCTGDSFTLGAGVADDQTWCSLLATRDPRLETINLGQGGYGVDQAFLWFERVGAPLAPAVHLFAFIDGDFERMRSARFLGDYGKPTLALRDGRLVVENVPAWRRPFWLPTVRVREIVKRTKTYELVERLRRRAAGTAPAPAIDPAERARVVDTALAVFAELRATAARDGGTLVLVYLPTRFDCALPATAPSGLTWWPTIGPRAAAAGFRIADLSAACRRLSAAEQEALFFAEGVVQFYAAAGHYTAAGNRFVAEGLQPYVASASAPR